MDSLNHGGVEQGDEADEAKHIGASQLIPGVRLTVLESRRLTVCSTR